MLSCKRPEERRFFFALTELENASFAIAPE